MFKLRKKLHMHRRKKSYLKLIIYLFIVFQESMRRAEFIRWPGWQDHRVVVRLRRRSFRFKSWSRRLSRSSANQRRGWRLGSWRRDRAKTTWPRPCSPCFFWCWWDTPGPRIQSPRCTSNTVSTKFSLFWVKSHFQNWLFQKVNRLQY